MIHPTALMSHRRRWNIERHNLEFQSHRYQQEQPKSVPAFDSLTVRQAGSVLLEHRLALRLPKQPMLHHPAVSGSHTHHISGAVIHTQNSHRQMFQPGR